MMYFGTVKSFNAQKGYGFIDCADLFASHGKDVFLLKSSLPTGIAQKGDEVSFNIEDDAGKGPVATNVQVTSAAANPGTAAWSGDPGAGFGPPQDQWPQGSGARYYGTVKSFNAQKGYGFVDCPDLHQAHGKDVFLMKSSVPGGLAQKGDAVTFSVEDDAGKGPVATNVQVTPAAGGAWGGGVGPGRPPMPATASPSQQGQHGQELAAMQQLKNMATHGAPSHGAPSHGHAPPPHDQWTQGYAGGVRYYGAVKSFNAQKGYGFIDSPDLFQTHGKDVFLMKSSVPGGNAQKGDEVSFNVEDDAGKGPVATNVQVTSAGFGGAAPGGGFAAPQDQWSNGAGMHRGRVKMFNAAKGYGMIDCPETHPVYGKDVFVAAQQVPGGNLQIGQEVRFVLKMEDKGPAAGNVQLVGAPAPASYGGAPPSYGASRPPSAVARPTPYGAPPAAFALQRFGPPGGTPQASPRAGQRSFWGPGGGVPPQLQTQSSHQANQVFFGAVKGFNEEKGWGHIGCDITHRIYQKDIFFMRSSFADPNFSGQIAIGAQVSFKASMANKGPQASEVAEVPKDTITSEGQAGRTMYGTVKSWNAEKAYGFIEGDDLRAIFGKDIFLHKRELAQDSREPTLGENASFLVELDKTGQPQARHVALQGTAHWAQ